MEQDNLKKQQKLVIKVNSEEVKIFEIFVKFYLYITH